MHTGYLMRVSAALLGTVGLAGSFLPHELLAALNTPTQGVTPLMVQVLAALLLSFAAMNWMAKDSVIGGIYNRPLVLGNLLHFFVGGMALLKAVTAAGDGFVLLALALGYLVFAACFAWLAFGHAPRRPSR